MLRRAPHPTGGGGAPIIKRGRKPRRCASPPSRGESAYIIFRFFVAIRAIKNPRASDVRHRCSLRGGGWYKALLTAAHCRLIHNNISNTDTSQRKLRVRPIPQNRALPDMSNGAPHGSVLRMSLGATRPQTGHHTLYGFLQRHDLLRHGLLVRQHAPLKCGMGRGRRSPDNHVRARQGPPPP